MTAPIADLRSDTVTRPTPAMRRAIARAEVGDDVFGDDPTVLRLQELCAERLGKEAALLVPSGTMANQVALQSHTRPGDELILEQDSHLFLYEAAGYAALAGVSIWGLAGERGLVTADAVEAAIRPPAGLSHFPETRLVWIENSHNRAGGTVYSVERLQEIATVARRHGLALHLDGARCFNAAVALGEPAERIAAPFDSVSVCLSKGLGCPVGSLVAGSRDFIRRAHRVRKRLGGGMRQAGVLAAAGIHALEHHVERLAQDHARARRLAEAWAALPGVEIDLEAVQTNMVYAHLGGSGRSANEIVTGLRAAGVWVTATAPTTIRALTHLDVDERGIDAAIEAMRGVWG